MSKKRTNNSNYYMEEGIGVSGVAPTGNPAFLSSDYLPFLINARRRNVGLYYDKPSLYDENLGDLQGAIDEGLNIGDLRADSLSGWDMTANAVVNNIVTAGTTAISGTLGLVDGIFEALLDLDFSKIWDNTVTNAMTDYLNYQVNELTPIYRGKQYEDSSLFEKLGTGIFWADLVQNLGFTEGMLIPGVGISKLLTSAPKFLRMIIPSFVSSMGEASLEAVNTKNDEINSKLQIALQRFNELSEGLSPETILALSLEYDKTMLDIESDAKNAGNFVFGANVALLSLTNTIEFGNLFSRGFNTAKRLKGALSRKDNIFYANSPLFYTAKATGKKLIDATTEGMEEVALAVISNTPQNYTDYNTFNKSVFNPEKRELVSNLISALGQSYAETINDPQTAEEFASGFIIGALGVPVLRKSIIPIKLENNIFSEIYDSYKESSRQLELADNINKRLQNSKQINSYYNGLVRHLVLQDDMNIALELDNAFDYKNAESAQFISDIRMFDLAGDILYLRNLINNSIDTSDEGITELIKNTTKEDGTGPFMWNGNLMSIEEVRDIVEDKKRVLNQKIDSYLLSKQVLETLYPNADNTTIDNAIFLKEQLNDHSLRFNDLIENTLPKINLILNSIKNTNKEGNVELINISKDLFINKLGTQEFNDLINLALNDNTSIIPYDEREDVKKKFQDLIKLKNNITNINKSLKNVLLNPSKSQEDLNNILQEAINNLKKKQIDNLQNEINSLSTFGEVNLHLINNLDDDGVLLNEDLYNNSNNSTVKDFDKAIRFRREVYQAIDNTDYDDLIKLYLKELIEKRFNSIGDYNQLTNPNEGVEEENSGIGDIIQIANDIINNNPTKQLTSIDTNNIPIVDNISTGNDLVSTTPLLSLQLQEIKGLNDLLETIPVNMSNSSFNNTIDKLKEDTNLLKEIVLKAFEIKENNENALLTALEEAYKLKRRYIELNLEEEFNQKTENFFNLIEERIKSKLYSIDNSNSQDNSSEIQSDNFNNEDVLKETSQGEPKPYLRSDLTEFTIDSFKDGTLEKFADKFPNYKTVYDKIMYDYINKGNVKVGDTIELRLEPTESNGLTYETVYMYHNNNIVGVLPRAERTDYKGIQDIYKLLREGKQLKTTVSLIMLGKFPYTRTERRPLHLVKGVNGAENVKLGIMTRAGMVTNEKQLDDNTENVFNFTNAVGKVYMLLKNSRGKFSPKRVIIKRLNGLEFPLTTLKDSGNPVATRLFNLIDLATKIIINGIRTNNMDSSFNAMDNLFIELSKHLVLLNFHMDLMLNPQDGSVYIQFRNGDTRLRTNISEIHDGLAILNLSELQLFNLILTRLYNFNPIFNINAKKINNPEYNKEIIESGLLETYISDSLMVGSWFTTNYLDANGNEQVADKVRGQFNLPSNYESKVSFNDSKGNQYTFYMYADGVTEIWKRSIDNNGKEVNLEVNWDLIPALLLELYKAEILYGDVMNGPNLINGILLIEKNGKKYALDRKNKAFLSELATNDFIRKLNEKNNSTLLQAQLSQLVQLEQNNQNVLQTNLETIHQINTTIKVDKDGKKIASMSIPRELHGLTNTAGVLLIDDVLYPIIIIDRPNGELHNYTVLLPNGKETDFGVKGFTNTPKEVSIFKVVTFLTSPENIGETILTFKDNLTLQLSIQSLLLTLLQQQVQQLSLLTTQDIDSLIGILDINIHNVPTSDTLHQNLLEIKSESLPLINVNLNIDLSYDTNIELLQAMLISREDWENMSDDTKQATLNCN